VRAALPFWPSANQTVADEVFALVATDQQLALLNASCFVFNTLLMQHRDARHNTQVSGLDC